MSPGGRHRPPAFQIVHHQDELVVVIAVQDLDVDAGIRHPAGEEAELPEGETELVGLPCAELARIPTPKSPAARRNAASLPSGDGTLLATGAGRSALLHCLPRTSQVQRFKSLSNQNDCASAAKVICWNGKRSALTGLPMTAVSAFATAG